MVENKIVDTEKHSVLYIFGLLIGENPVKLATEGGKAFWILIPFTMQMAFINHGRLRACLYPGCLLAD